MRLRAVFVALIALSAIAPPAAAQDAAKPKPKPKAAAKPAPKGKKPAPPPKHTRKAGQPGQPDAALRRVVAGTASSPGRTTHESPELKALRELDLQLFPAAAPNAGLPWLAEGSPLEPLGRDRGPVVSSSGLPPDTALQLPRVDGPVDTSWLRRLDMPDIPVRWDARVVRYLEYYKNTARGRAMVREFIRKSGRYGASIRKALREQGVPEDILWLALVESGFDASIRSGVGAAGLWQFMPDGAKVYGLTVDRWIDERLDPERSTVAAARYLSDLKKRFGNWEFAFAAYNMGYGGLLASIRKYNTNDFWELSRLEAGMPLETALYVPKIVAMAIVAKNRAVFGCADVELEPSVPFDRIAIGPGVSLRSVAIAAGVDEQRLEELNPQMLAGRTPPDAPGAAIQGTWTIRVPAGKGAQAANSLVKAVSTEATLARYRVRWGESLDDIAAARQTTRGTLAQLNGIRSGEVVRPGTLIFVLAYAGEGQRSPVAENPRVRPTVVVPAEVFSVPGRKRAFYRVVSGDTLRELASALSVPEADLARWNALDPAATLHDGMTLQVFVPAKHPPAHVALLPEAQARVIAVGSPEFFTHFETQRGRKRVEMTAKAGDTWRTVAKRNNVTLGQLERINQRARSSSLAPGEKYVVYLPLTTGAPAAAAPRAEEGIAITREHATEATDHPGRPATDPRHAKEPEPTGIISNDAP